MAHSVHSRRLTQNEFGGIKRTLGIASRRMSSMRNGKGLFIAAKKDRMAAGVAAHTKRMDTDVLRLTAAVAASSMPDLSGGAAGRKLLCQLRGRSAGSIEFMVVVQLYDFYIGFLKHSGGDTGKIEKQCCTQ